MHHRALNEIRSVVDLVSDYDGHLSCKSWSVVSHLSPESAHDPHHCGVLAVFHLNPMRRWPTGTEIVQETAPLPAPFLSAALRKPTGPLRLATTVGNPLRLAPTGTSRSALLAGKSARDLITDKNIRCSHHWKSGPADLDHSCSPGPQNAPHSGEKPPQRFDGLGAPHVGAVSTADGAEPKGNCRGPTMKATRQIGKRFRLAELSAARHRVQR